MKTGNNRGFGLLLVALTMMVLSILAINSITQNEVTAHLHKAQITRQKMQKINEKMINFVATNARLPCPASPTDLVGSATFGLESRDSSFQCNATNILSSSTVSNLYSGAAPVRSLGLDDEYMIDGWGNKIEYIPSPGLFTGINENYSGPNYINSGGALTINNQSGVTIDSETGYVLISRGEDGYAAYNAYSGIQNPYPPNSLPIEQQNAGCTPGGSCGAAEFDGKFIIGATYPNVSDDLILYRDYTEFMNSCFVATDSIYCLQDQCVNNAAPVNWNNAVRDVVDKEEVMIISSNSPLPSLDLSQFDLFRTGDGMLIFTIDSLKTENAVITLNFNYSTTSTSGLPSGTIPLATFSSSGTATFTTADLGTAQDILFGAIPPNSGSVQYSSLMGSLSFSITETGSPSSAYMTLSDISLTNFNTNTSALPGYVYAVQDYHWINLSDYLGTNMNSYNLLSTGFNNPTFISNPPTWRKTLWGPMGLSFADTNSTYSNDLQYFWGYITPTTSGAYSFWITSDNSSTFWLSTNNTNDNALTKLAWLYSTTAYDTLNDWQSGSPQQSSYIMLNANQSYYFEVWHMNGGPPEEIQLGWSMSPSNTPTTISNTYISTVPMDVYNNPPVCKAFYTTSATLTPASNPQPADIIPLNNTYGRYVKLSLLSSQPTSSGEDPRQDVYFMSEVAIQTTAGTIINYTPIFDWSSDIYVDNGAISNDRPYQAQGIFQYGATYNASTTFGAIGDFITNGQYPYAAWVTQNTLPPQYVIIDLGVSTQLESILIWNGSQLYAETTVPAGCSAPPVCSSSPPCPGNNPGICYTDSSGCPVYSNCQNNCPIYCPTQAQQLSIPANTGNALCLPAPTYEYDGTTSNYSNSSYVEGCQYNSGCGLSGASHPHGYSIFICKNSDTQAQSITKAYIEGYWSCPCSTTLGCTATQCPAVTTCCPGRSVLDVQVSVSDDPYYLLYNTP